MREENPTACSSATDKQYTNDCKMFKLYETPKVRDTEWKKLNKADKDSF